MSEQENKAEQELIAARDVLLAAARHAFPKLEKRIRENPTAQQHPQFDTMVRVLINWYAGMQRRVVAGDRPNHSEGDIHTRIFNTAEIIRYAASDAKIPDFQNGGAAILADHVITLSRKEWVKIGKNGFTQRDVEENIAEIELVAAMYASLLGIENQYEQAKRNAGRSGGMTP